MNILFLFCFVFFSKQLRVKQASLWKWQIKDYNYKELAFHLGIVICLFSLLCCKTRENMSSLFIPQSTHSQFNHPSLHPSFRGSSKPLCWFTSFSVSSYRLKVQTVLLNNLKSHRPYLDFTVNHYIFFLQKNVLKFPII